MSNNNTPQLYTNNRPPSPSSSYLPHLLKHEESSQQGSSTEDPPINILSGVLRPSNHHLPNSNIPFASQKIEGKAIKYLIVIGKLKEKGFLLYDLIKENPHKAFLLLKKNKAHCFTPKSDRHTCKGDTDAIWKLKEIKNNRIIRGKFARPQFITQVEQNETEAKLKKAYWEGCSFSKLEYNQRFFHLDDKKEYKASGDVYVCIASGNVHVCTQQACTYQISLPKEEGIECQLTHKFYGQAMVYADEERNYKGMDGAVTQNAHSATKGGSGGMNAVSSNGYRQYPKKSRQPGAVSAQRKKKNDKERTEDVLDSRKKAIDPNSSLLSLPDHDRSFIEERMTELFPRVKHPIPSRTNRIDVTEAISLLIYNKVVRESVKKRLTDAEQQAEILIKTYYRECAEKKKLRDPFEVMEMVNRLVRPHFDRLITIGVCDRPVDKKILLYFQEAVICTWQLLHYMPYAQRFQSDIPLKKHTPGLLYKLQVGFYVKATYDKATKKVLSFNTTSASSLEKKKRKKPPPTRNLDQDLLKNNKSKRARPTLSHTSAIAIDNDGGDSNDSDLHSSSDSEQEEEEEGDDIDEEVSPGLYTRLICFIPRYSFLECLPQKNDLNKFLIFKQNNISSNQVVETEKLICNCYESLIQTGCTIDRLMEFALEAYIKLAHFI